jgi:hypothetical protein
MDPYRYPIPYTYAYQHPMSAPSPYAWPYPHPYPPFPAIAPHAAPPMLDPDLGHTHIGFPGRRALPSDNTNLPAELIDPVFKTTSVRPAKRHKITSTHSITPQMHEQPDGVNINAGSIAQKEKPTLTDADPPMVASELRCTMSLYDNTDFRDVVRRDAYCLLRLLDPSLTPWTLHQSLWDVRPPDGTLPRSLTEGCAFVQLDPTEILGDDDALLTTRLLKPYEWACAMCTAKHTKVFSCTWTILLGAGLLTRAQWRGLNLGSQYDSSHIRCAYVCEGTYELFRSCGIRECSEPGHIDALGANECTDRLADGFNKQILHTHPAFLDPMVQRRLYATIYVSPVSNRSNLRNPTDLSKLSAMPWQL